MDSNIEAIRAQLATALAEIEMRAKLLPRGSDALFHLHLAASALREAAGPLAMASAWVTLAVAAMPAAVAPLCAPLTHEQQGEEAMRRG